MRKPLYYDEYLFIYDTLQSPIDHPAREILVVSGELEGRAWWEGKLFNAGVTAAAVPDSESKVWGELYGLKEPSKVLAFIDQLKESDENDPDPHDFEREKHQVQLVDGPEVEAWVYIYQGDLDEAEPIPHGDFVKFVEKKRKESARRRAREEDTN